MPLTSRIQPDQIDPTPITQGVWLGRLRDGRTQTNVPHLIVQHSPTGFEWGYGGSGPADLALNICHAVMRYLADELRVGEVFDDRRPHPATVQMYQDFKSQFLVPMDREGGHLEYQAVRRWVLTRYNTWKALRDPDLSPNDD